MLTRGYFIGEIVDELSHIAMQASTRNKLSLTDLSKFLENFFMEILSITLKESFEDLNQDTDNYPGIDIGATSHKMAFQLSTTNTLKKVKETLGKLRKEDIKRYDRVNILIIGKRQKKYDIPEELSKKFSKGFDEKTQIWDIDTILKRMMDASLPQLQDVYNYIQKNAVKARIELEVPDPETGKYPTSIEDYVEARVEPRQGGFLRFAEYCRRLSGSGDIDIPAIKERYCEYADSLSLLPRITREFYAYLLSDRERLMSPIDEGSNDAIYLSWDKLERICRYPDAGQEIAILSEHGLASLDTEDLYQGDDAYQKHYYVHINGRDCFVKEMLGYMDEQGIDYCRVLRDLNFEDF